ncbi:hypothetical protein WOLCODRAFT_20218 [Wolfiporia cocos MD-104 SS10]|uniref:Uncharacterized protein n=1 Tax=Wolfiporia cocos (strain MD-104) TaxID=742152 RepID=A0A2H3J0V0_WOLCO|nr:hypothetical protein WOLCODRAFT_20218 [Wolfiporia cocos MD-104 SS10]
MSTPSDVFVQPGVDFHGYEAVPPLHKYFMFDLPNDEFNAQLYLIITQERKAVRRLDREFAGDALQFLAGRREHYVSKVQALFKDLYQIDMKHMPYLGVVLHGSQWPSDASTYYAQTFADERRDMTMKYIMNIDLMVRADTRVTSEQWERHICHRRDELLNPIMKSVQESLRLVERAVTYENIADQLEQMQEDFYSQLCEKAVAAWPEFLCFWDIQMAKGLLRLE